MRRANNQYLPKAGVGKQIEAIPASRRAVYSEYTMGRLCDSSQAPIISADLYKTRNDAYGPLLKDLAVSN